MHKLGRISLSKMRVRDKIYSIQIVVFLDCYVCAGCGPGSSVGIATDYGLEGPGIESRWGEFFRLSRPALGPTQPPVQRIQGLSRG